MRKPRTSGSRSSLGCRLGDAGTGFCSLFGELKKHGLGKGLIPNLTWKYANNPMGGLMFYIRPPSKVSCVFLKGLARNPNAKREVCTLSHMIRISFEVGSMPCSSPILVMSHHGVEKRGAFRSIPPPQKVT